MVIGLDGATWRLLDDWIEKNELPTLDEIARCGVKGNLKTTIPPITPVAWASFVTGKNPGKHGVFGFESSEGLMTYSSSIKSLKMWDILSYYGLRSCILYVPMTYPVEPINGVMISDPLFTPEVKDIKKLVFPPSLIHKYLILRRLIKDIFYGSRVKDKVIYTSTHKQEVYDAIIRETETKIIVAKELIKHSNFNFFFIHFIRTDSIQHRFWNDKNIILRFYKFLDLKIKELINLFGQKGGETYIFIVSDHGFHQAPKYIFNVNTYIKYLLEPQAASKQLVAKIFSLADYIRILLKKKLGINPDQFLVKPYKFFKNIEPKTIAEFMGGYFITLKNDFSNDLKRKIIDELRVLKGPDHKRVLFLVCEKEKIYWGKYLDNAPDIILVPNVKYQLSAKPSNRIFTRIHEPLLPGTHTSAPALKGIFLGMGPGVKSGHKIENEVNIWDIAPTILHILGLPIPQDMDGKVLNEIFDSNSPIVNEKIRYVKVDVAKIKLKQRLRTIKKSP